MVKKSIVLRINAPPPRLPLRWFEFAGFLLLAFKKLILWPRFVNPMSFLVLALTGCGVSVGEIGGGPFLDRRSLAVSDDGRVLVSVFGLNGHDKYQLAEYDVSTNTARVFDLPKDVHWRRPNYNPVNQREAVLTAFCLETCTSISSGGQLALIDLDTGAYEILTEGFRGRWDPVMSPDGLTIAFWDSELRKKGGTHVNLFAGIGKIDAETRKYKTLFPSPNNPTYFPLLGRISFINNNELVFLASSIRDLPRYNNNKEINWRKFRDFDGKMALVNLETERMTPLNISNEAIYALEFHHKRGEFVGLSRSYDDDNNLANISVVATRADSVSRLHQTNRFIVRKSVSPGSNFLLTYEVNRKASVVDSKIGVVYLMEGISKYPNILQQIIKSVR